jgi:uncharacterized protein YndB with AHSA1/START domain
VIIQAEISIAADPGRVFAVLADPATWFVVDPTLIDATPRTPLMLGATGTMRNRRGPGMTATVSWRTTELEPGARLTQYLVGMGYELWETVQLAPDSGGTHLTVVDTLVPTSIVGRLMVAFSRGIMERDARSRCARLKSLLEDGAKDRA